MNQPGTMP